MRILNTLLFFCFLSLFVACKKDLLHFNSVQKIESYSDSDRLNKIIFIDNKNGFIVGGEWYVEALILSTNDSGKSWQRKSFTDVGQLLNSATISPTGAVYCTGFEGKLMHSDDTGKTWQFNQLQHYWFRDVGFFDANHAVEVGGISFGFGLKTDIDSTGNLIANDSITAQLNQVKMVSSTTGYICGFGIVLKSTDGGKNWNVLNVAGDNFMAMDIHGNEIWMCGNSGSIFHSTDAGNNWSRLRNGNDITLKSYHLMDIKFSDATHGWAVGENGAVIYTDDAGHHWSQYDQFTTYTLNSIALLPDGHIMVVGDNGSIYNLAL